MPESSEGAGEASFVVVAATPVLVAALVCDIFRDLFGTGVTAALVLPSHAGLSLVTVALTECPSSDGAGPLRVDGVVVVRRLAERVPLGSSAETRRVPNLALAEDSRP